MSFSCFFGALRGFFLPPSRPDMMLLGCNDRRRTDDGDLLRTGLKNVLDCNQCCQIFKIKFRHSVRHGGSIQ